MEYSAKFDPPEYRPDLRPHLVANQQCRSTSPRTNQRQVTIISLNLTDARSMADLVQGGGRVGGQDIEVSPIAYMAPQVYDCMLAYDEWWDSVLLRAVGRHVSVEDLMQQAILEGVPDSCRIIQEGKRQMVLSRFWGAEWDEKLRLDMEFRDLTASEEDLHRMLQESHKEATDAYRNLVRAQQEQQANEQADAEELVQELRNLAEQGDAHAREALDALFPPVSASLSHQA